jgi:hypothetical protein
VTLWLGGRVAVSPVQGSARVHRMTAAWSVPPDGPLGYLAGRRPVLSLAFQDFRMLFGNTSSGRRVRGAAGGRPGRGVTGGWRVRGCGGGGGVGGSGGR